MDHSVCGLSLSLPTIHFAPFLKPDSPFQIADQVAKQDLNDWVLDILIGEQYFWESTLAQGEEDSVWSRQFNLAWLATFLALAAWYPNPHLS